MLSIDKTCRMALVMSGALVLAATPPSTVFFFASGQAIAATPAKVDAAQLQLNMRRSLSTILVAYRNAPKQGSRADASIIKAANEGLRALGDLEAGFKARDPKLTTKATSSLSVAVGRIEAISSSAKIANPTVREGIRALSANWAAYGSRYALTGPAKSKPVKVNPQQVKDLQAQVSKLRSQVTRLQAETRTNAQLAANVRILSAQLDRIEQNRIDEANYQRTIFLLGSYMGWMDGYQIVTTTYYPTYTRYFVVERVTYEYWETCWVDYYEPYYRYTDWGYYADPFTPTVNVDIQIEQPIQAQVDVYAEQNINIMIDQSQQAETYFTSLPAEEADVDMRQADYTLPTPAYELDEAETSRPLSGQSISTEPAPDNNMAPDEAGSAAEPSVDPSGSPAVNGYERQEPATEQQPTAEPFDSNESAVEVPGREPESVEEPSREQSPDGGEGGYIDEERVVK